jgi:small subunit ribosomal protein S20
MYRSQVKTMIRRAEDAIFKGETDSEEAVREAIIRLDKAAGKGIIHRNNAARRKSRLMQKLNSTRKAAAEA